MPPLESYATRVWDYWERNLDPDLFKDRTLAGAVRGKIVLITGASSGIGQATAVKVADAGATVLLVARSVDKLEETKEEIDAAGGIAHIHRCDLSDIEDIERMAEEVLAYHGHVDVLVNNAGRSIRRSVALSYDRFHDYERTIQLNYFGALRLILALLPTMRARKSGHIINISSIGAQTNPPRFSAYVASKAALDAFSRVIASEVIDDKVHITTIYMPLVRTPMIAPTRMYDMFPAITPEEAAEMIAKAMVNKPKKVATKLGNFGELLYAVAPKASDSILNTAYKLFPDSQAAKGKGEEAPRQGAVDRGRGVRAPDERRALVERSASGRRGATPSVARHRLEALSLTSPPVRAPLSEALEPAASQDRSASVADRGSGGSSTGAGGTRTRRRRRRSCARRRQGSGSASASAARSSSRCRWRRSSCGRRG